MLKKLKELEKKTEELPAGSRNSWAWKFLVVSFYLCIFGLFFGFVEYDEVPTSFTISIISLFTYYMISKARNTKVQKTKEDRRIDNMLAHFVWTITIMTVLASLITWLNKS